MNEIQEKEGYFFYINNQTIEETQKKFEDESDLITYDCSFALDTKINIKSHKIDKFHDSEIIIYDKIEDIIDHEGFKLKTLKIILLFGLYYFIEGFHLNYFYTIISSFQAYYNISNNAVELITAIQYLGTGGASLIVGYLSKRYSRRNIIIASNIGIIIFHVIKCFIKNVYVFLICRFSGAVCLGFYMILIVNIYTEYLPIKFRGFLLNAIWITWALGPIFFLLMCKIYFPSLIYDTTLPEKNQNFHLAIFQMTYVFVINLFLCIFFLEDSPRNLILTGKFEEARQILNYYTDNKVSKEDVKQMHNNLINSGENKFYKRQPGLIDLFNRRNSLMTILMSFVFFFVSLIYNGMTAAIPIMLKQVDEIQNSTLKKKHYEEYTINELIIFFAIGSIGCVVGGILSEIKFIGRKNSVYISFFIAFILALISIFSIENFNTLISISHSILGIGYGVSIVYAVEIYPTIIRDFAIGFLLAMSKLGASSTQFIFVPLSKEKYTYPIYLLIGIGLATIVILFFLPHENQQEIDSIIDLQNNTIENNFEEGKSLKE